MAIFKFELTIVNDDEASGDDANGDEGAGACMDLSSGTTVATLGR